MRRRLLRHHLPLALASAIAFVVFVNLPLFNASRPTHPDIFSGAVPRERGANEAMRHESNHAGAHRHGQHRRGMDHDGRQGSQRRMEHRSSDRQLTFATGYVAVTLLAFTLLIGPANLLLRKRNPVSSNLRRDAGMWVVLASVAHVVFGLQVHGGGRIADFMDYFVTPDATLRLNSFGLANWTGLGALIIALVLLAISNDVALRKLKAKPWKRLQRFNYGLFVLVLAHAFFYGALLRATSPFSILLIVTVIAVIVGQSFGIWLWRGRYARG